MAYVVTLGLFGVLSALIFFDLRQMRIPDALSFILLGLFALSAFTLSPEEMGIRLAQGAVLFMLGFLAFMFRLIGGGDVKILSALALFIPLDQIGALMLLFSATLIVGVCSIVFCRHLLHPEHTQWEFLKTRQLPMGLPIGSAGIIAILSQAFI